MPFPANLLPSTEYVYLARNIRNYMCMYDTALTMCHTCRGTCVLLTEPRNRYKNPAYAPLVRMAFAFDILFQYLQCYAFNALGGRKGNWPVKTACGGGGVLVWLSVWNQVQTCYGPSDATATHCLLLQ